MSDTPTEAITINEDNVIQPSDISDAQPTPDTATPNLTTTIVDQIEDTIGSVEAQDEIEQPISLDQIYIALQTIPREKLQEILPDIIDKLGGIATFEANRRQYGSYEHILNELFSNTGVEADRALKAISLIVDKTKFSNVVRDEITQKPVIGVAPRIEPVDNETLISGQKAVLGFLQATRKSAIKRIPLMNSGFHIDIVAPKLSEIDNFMSTANIENAEFGRLLGGYFYIFNDWLIKEAAMRAFWSCVVGSSLLNYTHLNVIQNAMKINDLDTFFWGLAALEYPDGFSNFKYICIDSKTNPACKYEETINADLFKMIQHNANAINKDAISHMTKSFMCQTPGIKQDDLTHYHKVLNFTGDRSDPENKNCFVSESYRVYFEVPSIEKFRRSAERLIALLQSTTSLDDIRALEAASHFYLYRQHAPYVKEIVYTANGVDKVISDPTDVEEILELIQADDSEYKFGLAIADYINRTKITTIAYAIKACPSCGHIHESSTGYAAVDPLQSFFTMQSLVRSKATS